jgi:hypothetical protein
MLVALLLSSFAHATEVGMDKQLGLGVATGYPYLNVTGKYYLTDKAGIAGYLGSAFSYQSLRAAWQSEITELANWDFARFPMYWQAGADIGLWTPGYGYTGGRVGLYGGLGVALQFHEVPAEVFGEIAIGVYPVNGYCHDANVVADGVCWMGANGTAGGRWYF